MKLSIIILNYRSWKKIDACLSAIFEYKPECEFEVIVVDNGSGQIEDEKRFLEKWHDYVNYLPLIENLGFGQGNQKGIDQAKGEYMAIINPDVRLWKDSLQKAVNYLKKNREVGLVGGQLRYPDDTIQDSYRSFPTLPDQFIKRMTFLRCHRGLLRRVSRYLMWEKDPSLAEPVDWVVGGFIFMRRNAYNDIGGFDPRYFLFMEDTALCREMWKHGYKVMYAPEVKATHDDVRLSSGGIIDFFRKKTLRIHVWSAIKYFWRYKAEKHPRARL